ncbi:MAG TPA: hypothetical protein VFA96_02885, partial [Nocardioides sp.]|nr:hypothetical protein [Nocardioides sp.]
MRQNVTISGKTMPIEVALVIGALLAAAAFLLWPVATNIGDVIRAVSHSGFERDFGLFLLCLLVFVAGMGVGLVILAWQLLQRDRVGRGVTYVVAGTLIAAVLFAKTRTGWDIGVAIASAAVIFLLGFSDPAREWFTGPESRTHALPVPIVVSATVATVMAAGTILVGLALLALGHLGDSQVQGVLLCVTGLITLAVLKGVRAGNQQARLVLSGLMIAAIVLTLSVGSSNRALGV